MTKDPIHEAVEMLFVLTATFFGFNLILGGNFLEVFFAPARIAGNALVTTVSIIGAGVVITTILAVLIVGGLWVWVGIDAMNDPVGMASHDMGFGVTNTVHRLPQSRVDCDVCDAEEAAGHEILFGRDVVLFGARIPLLSRIDGRNERCDECLAVFEPLSYEHTTGKPAEVEA